MQSKFEELAQFARQSDAETLESLAKYYTAAQVGGLAIGQSRSAEERNRISEQVQQLAARGRAIQSALHAQEASRSSEITVSEAPKVQKGAPGTASWDRLLATDDETRSLQLQPTPRYAVRDGKVVPDVISDLTLSDIAGAERAVQFVRESIIRPLEFPNLFSTGERRNMFVFYGVPGTGKTLLAETIPGSIPGFRSPEQIKALDENPLIGDQSGVLGFRKTFYPNAATMPDVIMLVIDGADIRSKYVGVGEKQLKRVYELARIIQPVVIFFDEADDWLDEEDQHTAGLINVLKRETAGFGKRDNSVLTIINTNFPNKLPGAIDSRTEGGKIEIGLPDLQARATIFYNQLFKVQSTPVLKSNEALYTDLIRKLAYMTAPPSWKVLDLNARAQLTEALKDGALVQEVMDRGIVYSGRDLTSIVKDAIRNANRRLVEGGYVRQCSQAEVSELCEFYYTEFPGESVFFVPTAAGSPNAIRIDTLNDAQKERVFPGLPTEQDYMDAWRNSTAGVRIQDIADQLQYNAKQGDLGQSELDKYWQDRIQRELNITTSGRNNTVPAN